MWLDTGNVLTIPATMGDRIDEFESLFRSADKPRFQQEALQLGRATLLGE